MNRDLLEEILNDETKSRAFDEKLKFSTTIRTYLREKDITAYNLGQLEKGLAEENEYYRKMGTPEIKAPNDHPILRLMFELFGFIIKDANGNICGTATFSLANTDSHLFLYKFDYTLPKETFKKFIRFVAGYIYNLGYKKMFIGAWDRANYIALSNLKFNKISFEQLCNNSFLDKDSLKESFRGGAIFEIETDKISTEDLNITTEEIRLD